MFRKRLRLVITFIAVLVLPILLVTTAVFATTTLTYPDVQLPIMTAVDIYDNYLQPNDLLVVGNYWVQWTTMPTVTIDQTMAGRFTTANGTELSNVAPYPYYDNGYQHGVFSMYFSAAAVATANITWGGSYAAWLVGDVSVVWTSNGTATTPPYGSTSTITWHGSSSTSVTSVLLGNNVLSWAATLSNEWSTALVQSSTTGSKLSTYGDQYFSNAIPGLRTACPQIYSASMQVPQYREPSTYPPYGGVTTAPSTYNPMDWSGIAAWLGLGSTDKLLKFIGWYVFLGVVALWLSLPSANLGFGTAVMALGSPLGAALGAVSWVVAGLMAMFSVIALGIVLLILRSGY